MFLAAERYFGDIPDIRELRPTFSRCETSKHIREVGKTLAFRGKLRNVATFPGIFFSRFKKKAKSAWLSQKTS